MTAGSRSLPLDHPDYRNPELPLHRRVADLISRMTLEEKVSQTMADAPAIERLGVPAYHWWNECLHGVARAGIATVFPQAIGLASTWNQRMIRAVATAISREARAKYHQAIRVNNHGRYHGLTFWSPNINIFRDPRWGRGQETYGEDPFLSGTLGIEFVKGIQGDDPKYLRAAACAKHYAVHSGPENSRHRFDAVADQRDLKQTYLPAFEMLVKHAKVEAVMTAYNRTNGIPCSAHEHLLQEVLREEWGFEGHVVSDCGAIRDIFRDHKYVQTPEQAAAVALNNGCDLNCGDTYKHLPEALRLGYIAEQTLDRAVKRLFTTRFRLGMFDPPEMVPYAQVPIEVNDCPEHAKLALKAARESMVLLKNDGLLPLEKELKRVAVIGPNADDVGVLLGNYSGEPSSPVTPLEGIRRKLPDTEVIYAPGCDLLNNTTDGFSRAVEITRRAELAIVLLGLSGRIEGEEDERQEGMYGDREAICLPEIQEKLLREIHATGIPVVLVLLNGSPVAINWAQDNVPAILEAWYPGQAAGSAIADVLFGDYNPAGRLPVTFYRSTDQLPQFEDYRMEGRTYRYFHGRELYPFGYGLSYTTFAYSDLQLDPKEISPGQTVQVTAGVTNTGDRAGGEVAQLYLRDVQASYPVPIRSLAGFDRFRLDPGQSRRVSFTITPCQMSLIDDDGRRIVEPGKFEVSIGGGQPGEKCPSNVLAGIFEIRGDKISVQ